MKALRPRSPLLGPVPMTSAPSPARWSRWSRRHSVFQTNAQIADLVRAGEPLAKIGATVLAAPLDGGLSRWVLNFTERDGRTSYPLFTAFWGIAT